MLDNAVLPYSNPSVIKRWKKLKSLDVEAPEEAPN